MSKIASKINSKLKNKIEDKIESANKKSEIKKNKQIKIKVKAKNKSKTTEKRSRNQLQKTTKKFQEKELIVIDEAQGLIFENEKTLLGYFGQPMKALEERYTKSFNPKIDFTVDEIIEREMWLESVLDDPDEIWIDNESFPEIPVYTLIKEIQNGDEIFSYVACVYLNSEEKYPTFVFVQFATKDHDLADRFREKEMIYHRKLESAQFAAIEGDSLIEGDYLAMGLLEAMMKVRSEKDIPASDFKKYANFREEVINDPDEIWRKVGSDGQVLVTFISDVSDNGVSDLHYVVVTEEDQDSQVHSLLFSFPTTDEGLLSRYRQGENLEADEVVSESSH